MTSHFRRTLATLAIALTPAAAFAQTGTVVTGRVVSEANTPLPDVSVRISNLALGALTDAQGQYRFVVPSAQATGQQVTLVARRLGYQPKSATITLSGERVTQDFTLTSAPTQLEGIVVTALGIEKEKKALGVAQQTLDSSMLTNNARTTNLVSALSGKIAGINVTSATTQGGSSRVVIRGATSINGNNQPLFVVDGIPIDNSSFNAGGDTQKRGYGGFDYGNTAQDLNPDDIASISVLKGPNAAALYGARAANGAIIVTTKSGRGNKGFNVTGSTNLTFESPLRLPKYQNSWGQGYYGDVCSVWKNGGTHFSEGAAPAGFDYSKCGFSFVDGNYGGENDGVDESWGPALDGTPRSQFSLTESGAAEVRPWVAHPNNVKDYFQTGRTVTTNGAAQGASDKANFRLSLTREDVKGMVPTNSLNRTTAALNAGAQISSKLSTNGSIQYINNQGNNPPAPATTKPTR